MVLGIYQDFLNRYLIMETTKKVKNHNSSVIDEILNSITKAELLQTERKMSLAIKIADAIEKNGYSKSEFAKKLEKIILKSVNGFRELITLPLIH